MPKRVHALYLAFALDSLCLGLLVARVDFRHTCIVWGGNRKLFTFYILHLLVALAGHLGGSCGLFPHLQSFPSFFFTSVKRVRACTYEIDRETRERELRVSDREAGKSTDSLPCVLYIWSILSYVVLPRGAIPYPSIGSYANKTLASQVLAPKIGHANTYNYREVCL